jgi:hypothetical protein
MTTCTPPCELIKAANHSGRKLSRSNDGGEHGYPRSGTRMRICWSLDDGNIAPGGFVAHQHPAKNFIESTTL